MLINEVNVLQKPVTIADLVALSERAAVVLEDVRDALLQPLPRKQPPVFTSSQICQICEIDKSKFPYLLEKNNLPVGTKKGNGRAAEFSLEELYQIVKVLGNRGPRPEGKDGIVVAACNYKGGVAKTGTIVALAQGLTLLGRRCLLIDADPQGSATQLMGISPDTDVEEDHTLMPLIFNDVPDLTYATQDTYWPNLDIIPASSALFSAEFVIPTNREKFKEYKFWDILRAGLEPLKQHYDVILIDTSPSLSYMTINALFASDALIMPCPPDALDFASSTQFWKIFGELGTGLPEIAANKKYDFIGVLLTKVKNSRIDSLGPTVKKWMHSAYGANMLPFEVPDSSAARLATGQYKTIYDISKPEGSVEAHNAYKDSLDRLVRYVDDQIINAWRFKDGR